MSATPCASPRSNAPMPGSARTTTKTPVPAKSAKTANTTTATSESRHYESEQQVAELRPGLGTAGGRRYLLRLEGCGAGDVGPDLHSAAPVHASDQDHARGQ